MMPGTKIKGAFLTLFNGSIISNSLEVLWEYYTLYLICSRPDWYGVPGIANSENPVLTFWYIWGLDNGVIYVLI
jgi:hypothetical protein